jgi:hypothetical protein
VPTLPERSSADLESVRGTRCEVAGQRVQLPRPFIVHTAPAASRAAQCGDPRAPHSTVATRCPTGTRDPTTNDEQSGQYEEAGEEQVRAISVRYDPAFRGQSATVTIGNARQQVSAGATTTGRIPKLMAPPSHVLARTACPTAWHPQSYVDTAPRTHRHTANSPIYAFFPVLPPRRLLRAKWP